MELNTKRISEAFSAWSDLLGPDNVWDAIHAKQQYGLNTLGIERTILGAVMPADHLQVMECVKIANQFKIPLYTVSTGRNWGYGSALPATQGCVILDLRLLNHIIAFDPEKGLVTLQPGVTQQQLYDYMQKNHLNYMVPTTGAGPEASVLANALERGFGITPQEDHFAAMMSVKAILPDGRLYQSALHELGGHRSDAVFKWKMGPFLDGLFAQSNFGIVVQGTIALAAKPENMTQLIAFIDNAHFEEAVAAVAKIRQQLGSMVGGINLMNKRRLLAMVEASDAWDLEESMPEVRMRLLAARRKLPDWAMLGGIYGSRGMTAAAKALIKKELAPFASRILFPNRKTINFVNRLAKVIPLGSVTRTLASVDQALQILEGKPSRVALPLAYLKNPNCPGSSRTLSPDRDRCGLIWFAPLLPIEPALVRDFSQEVTRVCVQKGIEPLITFTAISKHCFDATIPIVFDLTSELEKRKARDCLDTLIALALEFGIFPYRLDIDSQRKYLDSSDSVALDMIGALKSSIDPNGILSPGRYSMANSK